MRRNGNLSYPESLFLKLDQDLRVKMKLIRALFKGHLLQGFAGIGPKAGVVFRKLHAKRPIFEGREELVPEKLVQRHTALQRMTGHAGAEDQVGLIFQDRLNEIRDAFGRILHVTMKDHDNVIVFLDGMTQAFLLVPAIAEIARIPVHVEIRDVVQQLVSHPGPEGVVAARVIDDVDLRGLLFEWVRDPLVRRNECAHRFIGHDKNADAFHACRLLGSLAQRLHRS